MRKSIRQIFVLALLIYSFGTINSFHEKDFPDWLTGKWNVTDGKADIAVYHLTTVSKKAMGFSGVVVAEYPQGQCVGTFEVKYTFGSSTGAIIRLWLVVNLYSGACKSRPVVYEGNLAHPQQNSFGYEPQNAYGAVQRVAFLRMADDSKATAETDARVKEKNEPPAKKHETTDEEIETLVTAIRDNDVENLKNMLQQGVDPNRVLKGKESALFEAIAKPDPLVISKRKGEGQNREIVNFLIKAGAKSNRKNRAGLTAMEFAVQNGNIDAIEIFQEQRKKTGKYSRKATIALFKALVNKTEKPLKLQEAIDDGAIINAKATALPYVEEGVSVEIAGTPVSIATEHKRVRSLKILLEAGAEFLGRHSSAEPYGDGLAIGNLVEVLHAAQNGDAEIIEVFISKGLKPNSTYWSAERITSPLHEAVWNQKESVVAVLLKAGWSPNLNLGSYQDDQGTLLDRAEDRGNKKIVTMLIKAGAKRGKAQK